MKKSVRGILLIGALTLSFGTFQFLSESASASAKSTFSTTVKQTNVKKPAPKVTPKPVVLKPVINPATKKMASVPPVAMPVISKEEELHQLYQKGIAMMTSHDNHLSYKFVIDQLYLGKIQGLTTTEEIDFYWDMHDKLISEAKYYFEASDLYKGFKARLLVEKTYASYAGKVDAIYISICQGLKTTEEIDVYWDQRDKLLAEAKAYYNYKG